MRKAYAIVAAILAAGFIGGGCRLHTEEKTAATPPTPLVSESASGPVTARLTLDPPTVRLDRDTMLTLQIVAPADVEVKVPALESRAQGFSVSGTFDRQPETKDGKVIRERCARLTPQLAGEYRIAPLAIRFRPETGGGAEQWFPTKAVRLKVDSLLDGAAPADIAAPAGPVWIYPSFKTVVFWLFAAAAALGAVYLLWRWVRRVRRNIQLRRMSPKERALHDLAELLEKNLVSKGLVKDFYFELTLIVRAYIERAHAIRAPEQTTEEFLEAVSHDPRFSPEVVRRLRSFLQAADLVKYAAYHPQASAVEQSLATARDYVVTDAEDSTPTNRNEPGDSHSVLGGKVSDPSRPTEYRQIAQPVGRERLSTRNLPAARGKNETGVNGSAPPC